MFTRELVENIVVFTLERENDFFELFAVNQTFASVIAPKAREWEIGFELDCQIRDEIEIEQQQEEEDRAVGFQWLGDVDSESSGSYEYDPGQEFWLRWCGDE